MLVGSTALLVSLLQLAAAATIPSTSSRAGRNNTNNKRATATFVEVAGNPDITDESYTKLTELLPKVLEVDARITSKSWEMGTITEAVLEVYNPAFTPFDYDSEIFYASKNQNKRAMETGPSAFAAMKLGAEYLAGYAHYDQGPQGTPKKCGLYKFVTEAATTPTIEASLVDEYGSLVDPCSLGTIAWVLANIADGKHDVGYELKTSEQYAWIVGNQLKYLMKATQTENFEDFKTKIIPHREDRQPGNQYLWSDMGFMLSPFIAYIGLTTLENDFLEIAINQWEMASKELLKDSNLYAHMDSDPTLWATGNGWMLLGLMRVLASIKASGVSGLEEKSQAAAEVAGRVFTACFDKLVDGLLGNDIGTQDKPETAGTSAVVAAYYRFLVLYPDLAEGMEEKAAQAFAAVVNKINDEGLVEQAVDPSGAGDNAFGTVGGIESPEAQSFTAMMWAARTAAGK